ncbi:MAG: hypothetical protein M0Z53_09490 [Thermaerobacter sp.]|nr:hypothetical protein [Thermaerobacter sp.]
MIIRILSEGQYRLDGPSLERIKRLDDDLMVTVLEDQPTEFHRIFDDLLTVVRTGHRLSPTELVESDLILPAADMTFAEAKQLFHSDSGPS